MTNKPMEAFTKAVEAALSASSYSMMTPIGREAALASIQAATADLLEGLKERSHYKPKWVHIDDIDALVADLRAEGGGDNG